MREIEVDRGGRVRARDAGDPSGPAVMHFHGTPGSRLDLSFDEHVAADSGVRLVSFDRPGYGGSTPAPFGLASIATDAHAVADALGLARFATLGVSGGGPGALAAATVPASRVSRVGVVSGAAPLQHVPGGLDSLDDNDRVALPLLASDPAGAAAVFAAGFEPLAGLAGPPTAQGWRLPWPACCPPATVNCWHTGAVPQPSRKARARRCARAPAAAAGTTSRPGWLMCRRKSRDPGHKPSSRGAATVLRRQHN